MEIGSGDESDVGELTETAAGDSAANQVLESTSGTSADNEVLESTSGTSADIEVLESTATSSSRSSIAARLLHFKMPEQPPSIEAKAKAGGYMSMVERSLFLESIVSAYVKVCKSR